jgi:hypothetical protein
MLEAVVWASALLAVPMIAAGLAGIGDSSVLPAALAGDYHHGCSTWPHCRAAGQVRHDGPPRQLSGVTEHQEDAEGEGVRWGRTSAWGRTSCDGF